MIGGHRHHPIATGFHQLSTTGFHPTVELGDRICRVRFFFVNFPSDNSTSNGIIYIYICELWSKWLKTTLVLQDFFCQRCARNTVKR